MRFNPTIGTWKEMAIGNCKLLLAAFLCVFMVLAKSMWSFLQIIEPDVGEWFFKDWRQFCFSGHIWLYLEVFLIVTTENGG